MLFCKLCGKTKNKNEFYILCRRPSGKIYYQAHCKLCDNKRRKKHYNENHEKECISRRKYYDKHKEQWEHYLKWDKTEEGRKRKTELAKIRRQKNPKLFSAGKKLLTAIKSGKLKRPSVCEKCGKKGKRIIAHHYDYDKPLDVLWICEICHSAIHHKKSRVLISD